MKKLFFVAAIAAIATTFTACNDQNTTSTTTVTSDSSSVVNTKTSTEGDMKMKDGKMMIVKGGVPVVMTQSVTLNNGTIVMTNGEVRMKDGTTMMLTEGATVHGNGSMIDKEGNVFQTIDRAGDKIQQGADQLKQGAVNLKEGDIVTIKFISDGAILQSSLSPASSQFIAIDATNGQNTIAIKANDTVVFEQSINGVLITNYPKRIVWQRTANPNQTSFVDSTNISFSFSNGFLYLKGTFRLIAANAVNEPALIKMFDFPTNSLTETYKLVIQNVLDSRYSQGFWGSNSAGINLRCVINTQGFFVPHDQFNGNGSAIGYQDFSVDGMIFSIS